MRTCIWSLVFHGSPGFAWALWIWLAGAAAGAQQPPRSASGSLEEIGQAMAQVDTVFTRFVQERHLSLFEEPLRSEGYLCFEKPSRLRWEIVRPYRSVLISDGSGVAQFEWINGRWQKLELGLAQAVQHVVTQIAAVMEGRYTRDQPDYEVLLTSTSTGPMVRLVPRNEMIRKMMESIEVHLAADLKATRRVVLRETGGDFTELRFENQLVNVVFPKGTFHRQEPLGLDSVRQAVSSASSPR